VVKSNRLPQMPGQIRTALGGEVKRAAFDIEAKAKATVPVDTGTARRSIHSVFGNGGLSAVIGPSVFYAKFLEFGVRGRAARPFMRPAAEAVLPRFADAVKRALAGLR
jgi:HK97 gp10 family phage protein